MPNISALLDAGYTLAADETCPARGDRCECGLAAHPRRSCVHPYEVIGAGGVTSTIKLFTESMMAYCRQVLRTQCVLENNSLRTPPLASYAAMYQSMTTSASRSHFRRQRCPRIGSLTATLQYAVTLGASSVELPGGYEALGTPSTFASITHTLAANLIT